ncbi:hypothetical protein K438DRAFT_2025770 [Mycena galopus ATCC 62051]|nr:hypothetical protein K438DRAFT_2025770 [Mycena galopus ATCC 62051]
MATEDPLPVRNGTPIDVDDEDNDSSNFTEEDANYVLNLLLENTVAYMSGNGFKKKAYTTLSDKLNARFPNRPTRSKEQVRNRIAYVKRIFEQYEFVRGKSGVGWDDGEKRASAETEFIDRFVEEYGKKFKKCFERTCPFYDRLAQLFGGNKATGANVLHLKKKKKDTKTSSTSSSTTGSSLTATSSLTAASSSMTASTRKRAREPTLISHPLLPLQNHMTTSSFPGSRTAVDISISEDENDEKPQPNRHNRSISGASSSGGRRSSRTTEVGNQIARGLKSIGEGMSAPLITKADTTHVDKVIDVLTNDPTLLPDDPEGQYYALLLDALGSNEKRARAFVKTTTRIHRIALLKRIFAEQEVAVEWQ